MCSCYLYCITDSMDTADAGLKGIMGSDLKTYACGKYNFLYSRIDKHCVYRELKSLKIHNNISLTAMESGTVLPFRYGTFVKDPADMEELQQNMNTQLAEHFEFLKGRLETGIKVFGSIKQEDMESDGTRPAIERLNAVKSISEPVNFLLNKVKAIYSEREREEFIASLSNDMFSHLATLVCDRHVKYGLNDGLLINGAFLIQKESFADFKSLFVEMKKKYPQYSLIFSGPWPPYNFVNIRKEGEDNE